MTRLDDWAQVDTFKQIMDDFENDCNRHLTKFRMWWLYPLINKYLDQYFSVYCKEEWIDENDEKEKERFKVKVMKPEIKEYYYLYIEIDNDDHNNRLCQLAIKYYDLIYDNEEPDTTIEAFLEDFNIRKRRYDEIPTFTKEAERYWFDNETRDWLSEALSRQ